MAIIFDANNNSGYQTTQSSYSFSHTTGGTDRFLFCGVAILGSTAVSNITYGGQSLTFVRRDTGNSVAVEVWRLINPPTGSNTLAVTLADALSDSVAGVVTFAGVDQRDPIEETNSLVGATECPLSSITTGSDSCWVVDFVGCKFPVPAPHVSQTQRWRVSGALGGGGCSTKGPVTPPALTEMSWGGNPCAGCIDDCNVLTLTVLKPIVYESLQSVTAPSISIGIINRVVAY